MHPALLVPEILLIVFRLITDNAGKPLLPTLAAVARTCRQFQHQVEGIIWYKIPHVAVLHNILPLQVQNRASRTWSLNRRILSGPDWKRFMKRASRVRVLTQNTHCPDGAQCSVILALAALRDPIPLLTPEFRELKWQLNHPAFHAAINLFIGPSLRSLEINAKLLINNGIRLPLEDICPKLEHLKITGNARSLAHAISGILRNLLCLETVACSTLDNDAFLHLAKLERLSYLAVDMRWSVLNLDVLRDCLPTGSFCSLQTLHWKDYDLDALPELFLMPDISPSVVRLEIESFCTSPSLCSFLHAFVEKFPHTRDFSLVHDVGAGRRFGFQVRPPGREHQLDARDLKPLLALKSLRALHLADMGHLALTDELVKAMASAFPELEQLRIESDATGARTSTCVTFDGLLVLLERCPRLHSLGLAVNVDGILAFGDTTVRHAHVTRLRLEGTLLGVRRAEVDGLLRRVLPGLKTIEETLNGRTHRVRDVGARDSASVEDGPNLTRRRRTRHALENGTR